MKNSNHPLTPYDGPMSNHIFKVNNYDTRTMCLICSSVFIIDYKQVVGHSPVYIYLFKFNNRNTRKRFEICSKLTTKTPERRQ